MKKHLSVVVSLFTASLLILAIGSAINNTLMMCLAVVPVAAAIIYHFGGVMLPMFMEMIRDISKAFNGARQKSAGPNHFRQKPLWFQVAFVALSLTVIIGGCVFMYSPHALFSGQENTVAVYAASVTIVACALLYGLLHSRHA